MREAEAIRRATEQDVPALLALLEEYFVEGEVRGTDSAESLLLQINARALGWYVAVTAAGIDGCVLCRVLQDLPSAVECKRLYVRPAARGGGVGRALMDTAEDAARVSGLTWMYLDSKDTFAVAMAMYERRGYIACARFNHNPEATLFFRKRLK